CPGDDHQLTQQSNWDFVRFRFEKHSLLPPSTSRVHPMAHEQQHAHYATQPVNFGDSQDDFFQKGSANVMSNDDGRKTYNDKSSIMTGWTSGITVPYQEPRDENGQSYAQAIASEYSARGSQIDPPPMPEPYDAQRRPPSDNMGTKAENRKSAGWESTGLSYVDENFRYYSTRGTPTPHSQQLRGDSPTDAHDAPLVTNAASMD
ncbi:12113_t:CDS:2, partial [Acaulospora colombiana]